MKLKHLSLLKTKILICNSKGATDGD